MMYQIYRCYAGVVIVVKGVEYEPERTKVSGLKAKPANIKLGEK